MYSIDLFIFAFHMLVNRNEPFFASPNLSVSMQNRTLYSTNGV